MKQRVGIVALDGVTDSGISVVLDVMRAANAIRRRAGQKEPFSVVVLSKLGEPVRAASGLRLSVDGAWSQLSRCQIALLPGCWVEGPRDLAALLARTDVRACGEALKRVAKRGARVGSSCSGSFILAEAGLLEGRAATTTWWLASAFRARFPQVHLDETKSLISQGRGHAHILTAGSVFAMADLALHLVATHGGPSLAEHVMRVLLLDAHPSQAPYMVLHQLTQDDPSVREAERYIRAHVSQPLTVEDVAHAARVSPRTLARRLHASLGITPIAFLHRIRLEGAAHMLETSRLTVDEVAAKVGYRDASTLRKLMHRELGISPKQMRRPSPSSGRAPTKST